MPYWVELRCRQAGGWRVAEKDEVFQVGSCGGEKRSDPVAKMSEILFPLVTSFNQENFKERYV